METRTATGKGPGLDLYVELVVPRTRGERVFLRGLRKWRDARAGAGPGPTSGVPAKPSASSAQLHLFREDDEVLHHSLNRSVGTVRKYQVLMSVS